MANTIAGEISDGHEGAVDFGWEEPATKLSGRRKKTQKKAKLGTFGAFEMYSDVVIRYGAFMVLRCLYCVDAMGLSLSVLKGIRRKGFRLPTPIQRKTIPLILQGMDIVGMARTGSGKTAAFVIPLLEKLQAHSTTASGARACILSPTRELALQTYKVVQELGRHMNLRTAVLVGGDSMEAQFTELAASPDILVATPGRLVHHLHEIDAFNLRSITFVVFDEADRLFEMGFADQLKDILSGMPSSRQTLLFSATMPRILAEFARAGLKDPELIRLDADTKISPDLKMYFFRVRDEEKVAALLFLLREVIDAAQSTIVFVATRHHVEFLSLILEKEKIASVPIHGNMDQTARKINMAKFKAKKAEVLVVTDVAARGLDIPLLDNVINYDFPPKPKLFVHRSGRVARAGRQGTSYNFVTSDELGYLVDLHLFLGRKLVPSPIRDLSKAAEELENTERQYDPYNPPPSEFGRFPQTVLDPLLGHVTAMIGSIPDLLIQQKSLANAKVLYIKTRPPASSESARRAKSFEREGIHPILAAAVPSMALGGLEAQQSLADITASLRAYRPSQTVFESQVASARAGQGAGMAATPGILAAAPHERNLEVMKMKREAHASAIESTKKQKSYVDKDHVVERDTHDVPKSGNRFRDTGFYLSHEPASGGRTAEQFLAVGSGDQFKDAIIDLGGEDAEGEARRKSSAWHWDNKTKRYVKLQKGETMKAGRRAKDTTQNGPSKKDRGKEGEMYKRWTKKTKMSIGKSHGDSNIAQAMGGRFTRGGRGWENPLKKSQDDSIPTGRKVQHELKSADQVRKLRREEQKKREKNLPKKVRDMQANRGGMSKKGVKQKGLKGKAISKKKNPR